MIKTIVTAAVLSALCLSASATTIVGATGAVINVGGPGFGNIADTYNQNGLSTNYTSGVTDFDAYIASNPTHTILFSGYEWFSNFGTNSATVTYDLGSVFNLSKLALWDEEIAGIGHFNLLTSTDGTNFTTLATGLTPPDNPDNVDYSATVFSFNTTAAQYVRLEMSGCPQSGGADRQYCAIGEVAFGAETGTSTDLPEPASLGLLTLGLACLSNSLRRRK